MIKAAVIGNPIKHSRSPLIHNHWLRKSGINGSYEALFAENEVEFINLIKKLRLSGYSGFNITVPFKKIASEIVDERINNEISYCNKDLPAINTIKIENDKLVGYNTDYYGFSSVLFNNLKSMESVKNIIILGAGGAAKSILYGLSETFKDSKDTKSIKVTILNRTLSKADELSHALKSIDSPFKFFIGSLGEFEDSIPNCDLLINSTSLGMEGIKVNLDISLENSKKDLFVYDIVYTPLQTQLLLSAKKFNRSFTNGLGMLINQAAPAFCLFYNYNNLDSLLEDTALYEKLEKDIGVWLLKIGLTGSIGMGKTETGKMFSDFGFPLYDADAAVHKLYGPGQKGSEKVKKKFPNAINSDGSVNRESLSKEVLEDPEKIKILENIIHPLVGEDREEFFKKNSKAKAIVLDIPLLFETGGEKFVDLVVVVDAPREIQEERVLSRPNMTKSKFDKIIAKQIPNDEKKKKADFIVDTSVSIDDARNQVENIVKKIIEWEKLH